MCVLFVPYFRNIAPASNKFGIVVEDHYGKVLCTGKLQTFYFNYPSNLLETLPPKESFARGSRAISHRVLKYFAFARFYWNKQKTFAFSISLSLTGFEIYHFIFSKNKG